MLSRTPRRGRRGGSWEGKDRGGNNDSNNIDDIYIDDLPGDVDCKSTFDHWDSTER